MKALVRGILEGILKRFGYVTIPEKRWHEFRRLYENSKSGGALSEAVRKVIDLHGVDCVFDVGANDGGFVEMLREEAGYKGWIISFEPLPDVARALEARAKADGRWEVMCLALGDREEERTFHRMASDVFSSFLAPDVSQPGKYDDSNKVVQSQAVPVSTVNALWPQIKERLGVKRLLLKMDTQGYDLKVFAGADARLEDIPALMSELSCIRIYAGAPSYREALDAYAEKGYGPSMLVPISFDERHSAIEFDALLVRGKS